MKRDKTTKPSGVQVRSVSLRPSTVQKINKQIIKDINAGKSSSFSSALNQVVDKARLKREDEGSKLTRWKVVLEDPRRESGTNTHIITLGEQATALDVKNALFRMQEDGHFMYHEKDLQFPLLHSIEQLQW